MKLSDNQMGPTRGPFDYIPFRKSLVQCHYLHIYTHLSLSLSIYIHILPNA